MTHVLIVDDELSLRQMTRVMLSREGYEISVAESGEAAVQLIEEAGRASFDLILTDLKMEKLTGIDVLRAAKRFDPSTQVVLMTAHATTHTAVEAMKEGAYHYVEKPFKREPLIATLEKAAEKRALLRENLLLRKELAERTSFERMVGHSEPMRALYSMIERTASSKATVLITGESGTGKELVARALHAQSPRADGPLVPVNCGAIPESLIESELFGYVKGAFTGANKDKMGLFEAADGGTLFLDEVGELPLNLQVKLLRALQEKRIQPVGSVSELPVDVRIVAATNRDLRTEIEEKRFREDLFYRLNVIELRIPPLRERTEDIPLLLEHFLHRFNTEHGKDIQGISHEATEVLVNYPYPGNVRELESIMERAVTLEIGGMISTEVLPYSMMQHESFKKMASELEIPDDGMDLEQMVENLERSLLQKALTKTGGNRTEAAKLLGISFRSIRYRLDKYNL